MTRVRTTRFWLVAVTAAAMVLALVGVVPTAAEAAGGYTVSGTVTAAATGKTSALPGVHLTFFDGHGEAQASAHTSKDGSYSASVPKGTYRVEFSYSTTDDADQYVHGTVADSMSVTKNTTKSYAFSRVGGTISSATPSQGLRVSAESLAGEVTGTTTFDKGGDYSLIVPSGKYAVSVGAVSQPRQASIRAYYSSGTSRASAKTVSVGSDDLVSKINITYKSGPVSLTIKDGKGKAAGTTALFYDASASKANGDSLAGWATVGKDGTLSPTLQAARGTYRVAFVSGATRGENSGPGVSSPPHMSTWLDKAGSFSKAKKVTVGADGVSVSGTIDRWKAPSKSPFTDVKKSYKFFSEITWMHATGISEGWPDGTYRRLSYTDRNAMAAFLYRMAGEPEFTPPEKSPFTDVKKSDQFYKEITWLASTGITKGWPDGTYRPTAPTDRNAMAAFLYRMAGEPEFTPPEKSPFTDMKKSYQFYKEVSWMADTGLSTGWPDKTYRRKESTDRNGMAAFIYRYMSNDMPVPRS